MSAYQEMLNEVGERLAQWLIDNPPPEEWDWEVEVDTDSLTVSVLFTPFEFQQ